MSGTGASNLGYGNITPGNNINTNFVNVSNTHNAGNFGSRVISGMPNLPGLTGAKWNVDAAKGVNPGICVWKGGLRRKIKNITKMYKMKGGDAKRRTLKRKLRMGGRHMHMNATRQLGGRRRHRHSKRCNHGTVYRNSYKRKSFKGGYAQYQNNLPSTGVYSTGGVLPSNQLALANPTPYQALSNCANCQDNYNHYTNKGFSSKGH
jgi:hypothetical protein